MRRRNDAKKITDALSPPPAPPTTRRTSRRRKSNLSDDENITLANLRSEKSSSSTKSEKRESVSHYEQELDQEEVVEGSRRRSHRNRTPVTEHYGNSTKKSSRSRSKRAYSPETRSIQSIQEEVSDSSELANLSASDRNHDSDMSEKQLSKLMLKKLQKEQNDIDEQKEEQEAKEMKISKKVLAMTDSPSIEEESDSERESIAKENTSNSTPRMESDSEKKVEEITLECEKIESPKHIETNSSSDVEKNNIPSPSNEFSTISPVKRESIDGEETDSKDEKSNEYIKDQENEERDKFDLQSQNESEVSNDKTDDVEELPKKALLLMKNNVEVDEAKNKDSNEKSEEKKICSNIKVVRNSSPESVEKKAEHYQDSSDEAEEQEMQAVNERRVKKRSSTESDDEVPGTVERRVLKRLSSNERRCPNAAEEEKEVCFQKTEVKIDKDPKPIDCPNAPALDTGRLRKRRWMTKKAAECGESVLAISTDSLKTLIADVSPVPLSDVQLGSSSEPEDVANSEREEGEKSPSTELEPNNWESSDKLEKEAHPTILKQQQHKTQTLNEKNTTGAANATLTAPGTTSGLGVFVTVTTGASASSSQMATSAAPQRTIGTASNLVPRSPSPARHQASNVLYITNLVRPFTLLQLKGLLARTGKISEDGFWIDRIKSKCYVEYETEE